jgi:hypothetical protein
MDMRVDAARYGDQARGVDLLCALCQARPKGHDAATHDSDVAADHIDGCGDGGIADDEIVLGHAAPPTGGVFPA